MTGALLLQRVIVFSVLSAIAAAATPVAGTRERRTFQGQSRDCAALTQLRMENVRITEAAAVPANGGTAAHCRVSGIIDTETGFRELLPDRWNGRFVAGGGGGFGGTIENQAEASVNLGYATVGGDTGHQGDGFDARWALGRPDRQINFGHAAVHRTTEVAKAIVKAYYGEAPRYSYFYGCSNGGRQGLMEAQRYPADFDGIVACAPALDVTNIIAAFIRNAQIVFPDPGTLRSVVTLDNLRLLGSKVLESCDALDGVADNVVVHPPACEFTVDALPACPGDRPAAACVTARQRAAIAGIYAPTVIDGTAVYPGLPFGSEAHPEGWPQWITGDGSAPGVQFVLGTAFFKYFVAGRDDWDYRSYDLSKWGKDTEHLAGILNAVDPDLSEFKTRGGKLILAHGWADPAINARRTIEYYEQLRLRDPDTEAYARLFMMPGVLHCQGGPGPDAVDWLSPIVDWVEHGRPPASLLARKAGPDGRNLDARPLCPYPQRAVYDGRGTTTEAASYTCSAR